MNSVFMCFCIIIITIILFHLMVINMMDERKSHVTETDE